MSQNVRASSRIHTLLFGEESGGDSNHITSSHFVVEFLNFLSSCEEKDHVLYDSRYRQIVAVLLDEDLASRIAADGFVVEMDRDTPGAGGRACVCVSCKAEVSIPYDLNRRRQHHETACCYRRLQQFCIGSLVLGTNDTVSIRKLIDHLMQEFVKTKFQVATEFGFSRDLICAVMTEQFLSGHQPFQTAGCLIKALIEFEERMFHLNLQPDAVSSGFYDFVDSYRSRSARQVYRCAARKGPPSRLDSGPSERQALMEETRTLLLQTFCKVCCKNNAEYVLLPCSHLALCHSCSLTTTQCPVCDEYITELIKTYIS